MHYDAPVARSWTRSPRLTPTFAGVTLREARRARQHPVAVQRRRRPRARRSCTSASSCAARASSSITEYVPTDERTDRALPAAAHHRAASSRQYNVGAQTRRTANVDLARRGRPRDPPARRRDPRHRATATWSALASRVGRDRAARAGLRADAARRRLHDVPLPGDRAPTSSPPNSPTGPPTAPSTRSRPCRCGTTNQPVASGRRTTKLCCS